MPGALQPWYQSHLGTLIALCDSATFEVLKLNEMECVVLKLMEFGVLIGHGGPRS